MRNLKRIPYIVSLILLAYMPFHIFLSQWLSEATGGLDLWKIGKDVVLCGVVVFTICLVFWQGKGNKAFRTLLFLTAGYAALHLLVWAFHPDIHRRSAELGVIYNMRLPLYAILGYGAVLLHPKFAFSSVIKLMLGVSTAVAILGIAQYFLPGDLLMHFGYSLERGARAAFYIDDNHNLPVRIMSTLREPNALGAYLILPATALGALLLNAKDQRRRIVLAVVLVLHVAAIVLTQSRSALFGVVLSGGLLLWWQYRTLFTALLRRFWPFLAALVVLASVGGFMLRNSAFFESYVAHGQKNEAVADLDSNQYHLLFVQRGLEGIRDKPLGHGPGTAGLASIQNPNGSFLTENYYVQIGYELGVVGLVVFVSINVWVYAKLQKRGDLWSAVLLASFWAYMVTNMLLHTWGNEAVAAQWWILAGLIIGIKSNRPGAL